MHKSFQILKYICDQTVTVFNNSFLAVHGRGRYFTTRNGYSERSK